MNAAPSAPSKPRPEGDWKACPHCGMTGQTSRIARWYGNTPQFETDLCGTCSGAGWLPAPAWYKLPVSQWPQNN